MQRNIQVIIRLDPKEYHMGQDDSLGAMNIVQAILQGETDFPFNNDIDIICEEERRTVKMNPHIYKQKDDQ